MIKEQFNIKGRAHLWDRRGFTFPEVLVTLMIFSFLTAAISAVMLVGNSTWQSNSVEVELQQDLRQAMLWMKNDMQQTGDASLSDTGGIPINVAPDLDTYPDPNDDPAYDWTTYTSISFRRVIGVSGRNPKWNKDTDDPIFTQFVRVIDPDDYPGYSINDVLRIEGAKTQAIAENIQSIQVRRLYDSSDVVEIALVAQKKTLSGAQGRTITLTLDFKVQLRN